MGYLFELPTVDVEPDSVATALDRVVFCAKAVCLAVVVLGLLAWEWVL